MASAVLTNRRCFPSKHEAPDLARSNAAREVEGACHGVSWELAWWYVGKKRSGVDVDRVASWRSNDWDPGLDEAFTEVVGVGDSVSEVVLLNNFLSMQRNRVSTVKASTEVKELIVGFH